MNFFSGFADELLKLAQKHVVVKLKKPKKKKTPLEKMYPQAQGHRGAGGIVGATYVEKGGKRPLPKPIEPRSGISWFR